MLKAMQPSKLPAWLTSNSEMAQRIRDFDWSTTPLGPIDKWRTILRTCISLMLNSVQPVYIAWGPEQTFLYNDAYIPILGNKHPNCLGQPYADVWADIWDEYRPHVEATMTGISQYFVDRPVPMIWHGKSSILYFTFSWTPITDNVGNVTGFYCVATDTTEHVLSRSISEKSTALLNEIEMRYTTLFKHSTLATAVTQMPSGILIDVNDAFTELFGYSREEVLGKTSIELGITDTYTQEKVRQEMAHHGNVQNFECVRRTRTGVRRIIVLNITPITLNGAPYLLTTIQDITDRQLTQQQLHLALEKLDIARQEAENANKAKTRFLAAASHDLRQPLSAISLYIDMLNKQCDPRTQPIINRLHESVGDLRELLTDLLDLSRFDAAVIKPTISEFVVVDALYSLETLFAPVAQSRGLKFHVRPCGHLAQTDEILFRRILNNLVSNAIRYTSKGGILIGCRSHQGRHWIEVWDTGVGIPNDKLQKIFEEYQQVGHETNLQRPQGSGLGLAIVDRAAKLLDLAIRVHSKPGRGTLFAIETPIIATPVESTEPMELN